SHWCSPRAASSEPRRLTQNEQLQHLFLRVSATRRRRQTVSEWLIFTPSGSKWFLSLQARPANTNRRNGISFHTVIAAWYCVSAAASISQSAGAAPQLHLPCARQASAVSAILSPPSTP